MARHLPAPKPAARGRRGLRAVVSCLPVLVLIPLASTGCFESKPRSRHVLLITVDTLRTDRLHCYGGHVAVSPTIDSLAAEGTLFESCYAPMGMTLACNTTLMTSKYPDETGVITNQHKIADGEYMLAERLTEAGFRCRGVVANGVLAPNRSGIDQGFEKFSLERDEVKATNQVCAMLRKDFGKDPERREFLWVHYMNPHQPYDPPAPYDTMFDPDYEGNIDSSPRVLDGVFVRKVKLPQRDLDHILSVYDGQVRFVDDQIQRVLAALKETGVEDDTLVVFSADHGEELYDHNCYFYHANSIYGSVTHVPFVLRQPGVIPAGRRAPDLVELVDAAPTILAMLGVPWAMPAHGTHASGMDLAAALDDERPLARSPYAFAQLSDQAYAVRTKRWLLVDNPNDFMPFSVPKQGVYPIATRELYDLDKDPREQRNVVEYHPEESKQLLRALDAWKNALARRAAEEQNLDASDLAELEGLGYVGGSGTRVQSKND